MFFVIIPLSTVLITERDQGTYRRLRTMGLGSFTFFAAKMSVYILINIIQGILLVGVGMYIVPLFGLPALGGCDPVGLLALLFALSFAAIGFAMLVASCAKSAAQAVIIGGLGNVLLGAIGGIMVPKFIMPPAMQTVTLISPMSWGYDGFIELFLFGGGVESLFLYIIFLTLFGIIMFLLALRIFTKKGE
jgi:ABC-2 type transport system permease protein